MKIFAIDPGNEFSAYCIMDDEYKLDSFAKLPNRELMEVLLNRLDDVDLVVIERMQSYGNIVGKEVFITCEWIGRFSQEAERKVEVNYIFRSEEKLYICGNPRAKDANIRAALIERFAKFDFKNGKGTIKKKDVFYGVTADVWAAVAIAVTKLDILKERNGEYEKHKRKL